MVQVEIARLYQEAKVNPLAGCLPTLATLPVWIGLYRALSNVTDEGLLTEGFFWIPSLAGPTSLAAQKAVSLSAPCSPQCELDSVCFSSHPCHRSKRILCACTLSVGLDVGSALQRMPVICKARASARGPVLMQRY
jgi:hypothetical protein